MVAPPSLTVDNTLIVRLYVRVCLGVSKVGNRAFVPSRSNMGTLPISEGVPAYGGLSLCGGIFIDGNKLACEDLFKGVFFRQWWGCGHL